MNPRVAQIIGSRGGGGAERFYVRLTAALHTAGVPVLAIVPPASYVDRELPPEVPRVRIPMRGIWDLAARWRIRRALSGFGADVAQTWMGRATRLTRLRGRARPVHIARLGGYYRVKGYRHAHVWIANTLGICRHLEEAGLPRGRIFHIGNFVDEPAPVDEAALARMRARLGIPSGALVVLGLGRLHPNKGFADLLEAFARLPAAVRTRPVHLVIAGEGPLGGELRRLAAALPAAPRIHWAGWVSDPGPLYALAEVFVCPSRHEPLGNVILEAWSHGVAVVSTRTAGPVELVCDGETGVLVPAADSGSLARAIASLLDDDGARRRLARAGREEVRRRHGRDAVLAAYLDLYRRLAAAAGSP